MSTSMQADAAIKNAIRKAVEVFAHFMMAMLMC